MNSEKKNLTILTDPIWTGTDVFSEPCKTVLRSVRNILRNPHPYFPSAYRGHFAVTRSLVEGLEKVGVAFNYNPRRLNELAENVVVLSGVNTLRQAIKLKKKGKIKILAAGPNILVWPSQFREIGFKEVDFCLTPCEWTCTAYECDLPSLKGRCKAWAAGVDPDKWKPPEGNLTKRNSITFYIKGANWDSRFLEQSILTLIQCGYCDQQIQKIETGNGKTYKTKDYFEKLSKSNLLIGLSRSESQGIAWLESWAMDVPTLIWHTEHANILGKATKVSAAPYLTEHTGAFFKSIYDLGRIVGEHVAGLTKFTPRRWVLKNMTDEDSAKKLLQLLSITY